jgi:hypothetical protein
MYVRMRKYPEFIGHRQLADLVFFWIKDDDDREEDTIKDKFADWLYGSHETPTRFYKICNWIYEKRSKRRVTVRIDKHDTWSMYSDLTLIILPMLKDLQKIKHGAPHVEDEDVPEYLRSTTAPPKENEWDLDERWFERWDYILEEMIWAFEQIVDDDDFEYEPNHHILPDGSLGEWMEDEAKEYNARVQNGHILFGKYFRNLWW